MPFRKVSLTNQGFKILSTSIYVDVLSILLTLFLFLYGQNFHFDKIFSYSVFLLISIIFYIYHSSKIGYIYLLSFVYQILLYFLLTPSLYVNFINILFTALFTFPLFLKGNPFQRLYFPLGLYMSLINSMLGLIEMNFQIVKFNILDFEGEEFQKLTTIFWKNEFLDSDYYFHASTFSPLENTHIFALLGFGMILFREYAFFLDFFSSILVFCMVVVLYDFEIVFYKEKILSSTVMWVLLVFGPGRNFGFSYSYTLIALGLTGIFSYSMWNLKEEVPVVVFIVIYFLIQSFLFLLEYNLKTKREKSKIVRR